MKQRTHYGDEQILDSKRLSNYQSIMGNFDHVFAVDRGDMSVFISVGGFEKNIKLESGEKQTVNFTENYDNLSVTISFTAAVLTNEKTQIYMEFRTEDNYSIHIEDSDYIKVISVQKPLDEVYISNDVARKSDIPTPDWNASYKEEGYIENRTHYETFHFKAEIDNDYKMESVVDVPNSAFDAHWHIEIHVQQHPWELWGEVYTYDGEVFFDIPIQIGPFEISTTWADGPKIPVYIREVGATDVWKGTIYITSSTIKPLKDRYIPDTIARKSDIPDIDPVVWKYMCNPIVITSENDVLPTDILKDDASGATLILPQYAGLIRGGYSYNNGKYINACAVKNDDNGVYDGVYIGGDFNMVVNISSDGTFLWA